MPVERRSQAVATEEGHEAASASATDIEDSTSDAASTAASDPADPTVAWCPPIPDAVDHPTEQKIASAADQLNILISQPKTEESSFCHLANLEVLPHLWLQARLQFTLRPFKKKLAASWSVLQGSCGYEARGEGATIEAVLPRVARALTVRLAEKLAQALSTLMRLAESMVTPETECLLYATYWFRSILSELLHTAGESAALNKDRAPSGPIKVLVTDRYGSLPAGRVKLHLSSWRTPPRMGKRRKFRNLLAPSELVWMTAQSSETPGGQVFSQRPAFLRPCHREGDPRWWLLCKAHPRLLRKSSRAEYDARTATCDTLSHNSWGHHTLTWWSLPWAMEGYSYIMSVGLAL